MKPDKKQEKRKAIEHAAYALIDEKGYLGTSMLAIARRARASNETLYNWYGDKKGLFQALIERNALDVKSFLDGESAESTAPTQTLSILGPKLLDLLLGDRAIALNRAAAADPTGELGKTLSKAGKETVFPLMIDIFEQYDALDDQTALAAAQTYLSLLVGDLQIRRATGAIQKPTQHEINERSTSALKNTMTLFELA